MGLRRAFVARAALRGSESILSIESILSKKPSAERSEREPRDVARVRSTSDQITPRSAANVTPPLPYPPPMLLANLLLAAANVVPVPTLEAPVSIAFDDRGIPAIEAASRLDAYAAEGCVHARDRFFQMDLMRRSPAGELAALLGAAVVDRDLEAKPRRFRALAKRILVTLADDERLLLEQYASGVNAAIGSMRTPPEYAFLGWPPAPWLPEDSILVSLAMHSMLAKSADLEQGWHDWRECLGEAMFEFLLCPTSRFDALLIEDFESHGLDRAAPIPGPDVVDLRASAAGDSLQVAAAFDAAPIPGSNAFAVSGSLTADGRAILANDPHLALSMPAIWYRLAIAWPGTEIMGLSLPGIPGIVIGSNGRVAWGFTNLTGDFEDWILVETKPGDDGRYLVPGGSEPFGERVERVEVRGGKPQDLLLQTTRWGPVLAKDRLGRPMVLRAAIDEPASTNFAILELHAARSVDDALATLARWRSAPQNAIVADDSGRIGWVVTGFLPDRGGADGRTARSLAEGGDAWIGPLEESRRPRIVDPASGFLFSANARPVPLSWASQLGSQWAEPTRANRIRTRLDTGGGPDGFDEMALLDIQLDPTVESLEPWRRLVLDTVPTNATGSLAALLEIVAGWNGRADEAERGPVVLEAVRRRVIEAMLAPILAAASERCAEARPSSRFRVVSDEPWLRLLDAQPDHFLPRRYRSWEELVLAQIREAAADPSLQLAIEPEAPSRDEARSSRGRGGSRAAGPSGRPGSDRGRGASPTANAERAEPCPECCPTWGERNEIRMRHPVSIAMPLLSRGYDIPAHPQPGHPDAIRVATPGFGASARLVVSPGREELAILETPGGQSGDPSSPHYRDRHEAWRLGEPDPLLQVFEETTADDPERRVLLVPGE